MKNKTIVVVLSIVVVILAVFAFRLLNKEEVPVNPDDNPNFTISDILGGEDTPDTPITNPGISEELANEPIIKNDTEDKDNEGRKPTHTFTADISVPEDVVPYEYASPFIDPYMRDEDFISHYGFTWTNRIWYHPVANSTIGFLNTVSFICDGDPNEKKEEAIYIVDSFLEEYPNVIYKNGEEIKNMLDIPADGLYILSDEEEGWYSLRIVLSQQENATVVLNVYLAGISKTKQLAKGVDSMLTDEIERIEKAVELNGIDFEWDIIIRSGLSYIRDTSHDKPKDPEDYTPEEEMLMDILGIL